MDPTQAVADPDGRGGDRELTRGRSLKLVTHADPNGAEDEDGALSFWAGEVSAGAQEG